MKEKDGEFKEKFPIHITISPCPNKTHAVDEILIRLEMKEAKRIKIEKAKIKK